MQSSFNRTNFETIRKQNTLAIISMVIVFIGSLGVGVQIVLSELLYPNIEEFSQCPLWYRAVMYASLFIVTIGIIGCVFFKNRKNTIKKEFFVNLTIFLIGLSLCIFFALARNEAYWKDVVICIGGAICSVGLFCGASSLIGLMKKLTGNYAKIYSNLVFQTPPKHRPIIMGNGLKCTLPNGATPSQIIEVENYFETELPTQLVEFLCEFNGDGNLLFSTQGIIETTKGVRKTFAELFEDANKLCCFGGDGCGNYFCYKINNDGKIKSENIYLFNHETSETIEVAKTLPELIEKYYSNEIEL